MILNSESLILVYFEFRLSSRSAMFLLLLLFVVCLGFADSQSQAYVEVKFVARQVEVSVVIRATKLKFVAESRTRVYFARHVA